MAYFTDDASNRSRLLVALAATACAGVFLSATSSSAATQLVAVQPAVSTSTNAATIVASTRFPQTSGVRTYNQVAYSMPATTSESEEIMYTEVAAPTLRPGHVVLAAVAAFGAVFMYMKKAVGGVTGVSRPQQIALDSIPIASVPGYQPPRRSMALNAEEATSSRDRSKATATTGPGEQAEFYEVELEKPLKIGLGRGNDGRVYIARVPPGKEYEKFTVGDMVTKCSASFGPEIWEALNYGQVMFAIKTRNGNVFLEIQKRYGDMSIFETKRNSRFASERAGGNYGAGTAQVQTENYMLLKDAEKKREGMWREAVGLVKSKKYEDALVMFEEIIGLEPQNYIGDNFALTTDMFRISHYQMACVYSLVGNQDAALDSLKEALNAGFDDYDQVRSDPDLAGVRELPEFNELINRYDESFINTEALNALKGMFGGMFGGKK
uniref:PDZ domain-containing protein n=1 Tax=Eutreptiella gymnastica TaxID=73025 RepID=A0A7S1NLC2_9EUGL